jgi:hypothetical protein
MTPGFDVAQGFSPASAAAALKGCATPVSQS